MIFKRSSDTNDIKSYLIQKNTENVEVTKFTSETAVNLRIFLVRVSQTSLVLSCFTELL